MIGLLVIGWVTCDWLNGGGGGGGFNSDDRKEKYCAKDHINCVCKESCGLCGPHSPTASFCAPTQSPVGKPQVTVGAPVVQATKSPTKDPSPQPTEEPTKDPSSEPIHSPTQDSTRLAKPKPPIAGFPVVLPTELPTAMPTEYPTKDPSGLSPTSPDVSPMSPNASPATGSSPTAVKPPASLPSPTADLICEYGLGIG